MNKIYLVTYNPESNYNQISFHKHITSLFPRYISDWWHYLENTYLIVSSQKINILYNAIFPGLPGKNLLIIEVDPKNAQGWLSKAAWAWLKKYQ